MHKKKPQQSKSHKPAHKTKPVPKRSPPSKLITEEKIFLQLITSVLEKSAFDAVERKSTLTRLGDAAKWGTERVLLHRALKKNAWNLSHTAEELKMGDASSVIRAIHRYKLQPQYDTVREDRAA